MTSFGYELPESMKSICAKLREFRTGGMQVTVELESGTIYTEVLISNCSNVIAVRGYHNIPFDVQAIKRIYQRPEDVTPEKTGDWCFFRKTK